MSINLEAAAHRILSRGPNRVMISLDEATSSRRAREVHGITADIIFIREDGWSLGAPSHLEENAYGQWADWWAGFMRRPEVDACPIERYERVNDSGC